MLKPPEIVETDPNTGAVRISPPREDPDVLSRKATLTTLSTKAKEGHPLTTEERLKRIELMHGIDDNQPNQP